jgi:hypothetical protein
MLSFLRQAVRKYDLDDRRYSLKASPIALKLAGEGDPTNGLSTGLNDTLEPRTMCFDGCARDCVDDGIDLVALPQRVERGERHTHFGPKRTENELATPGSPNGRNEVYVFPGINGSAIDRRVVLE